MKRKKWNVEALLSGALALLGSGGVFQNMYLLPRLLDALAADGFETYHHSRVSANDEGISLGQLVIADAVLRKEAL